MRNKSIELALLWLKKADHDLITARQTLALPDGPTDTPCFHAQQAVEKALKALLTVRQITFPKIHDLVRLLDIITPTFPAMESYREAFSELSEYSVEVRYPDDWFEPSRDDAEKALLVAEKIVAIICGHIKALKEGNTTDESLT